MADSEAEQAFFQAQATDADATEYASAEDQTGDNEDDEYDPSNTLDDQYQPTQTDFEQDADVDATAASNPNGSSDPISAQVGDAPDPSQTPSRAESQTSTPVPPSGTSAQPQTRTIGGFLAEDDDEDDKDEADYEPPAALGVDDINAMPMTMSEDPSSGNAIQNTSLDVSSQPPIQGSASVQDVANSSYSPAPVPNIDDPSDSGQIQLAVHDANVQTSTVPTSVPDSPSAARGRLPHDRVGILQDRIDEDPRGDIPAWLELIGEHRSRNRLDSAREAYERFLSLFPMAVSSHPSSLITKCYYANRWILGRSMGGLCYYGIRTQ